MSTEKILPPEAYGMPKFENLKISTITVMVYCNFDLSPTSIFGKLPISHVPSAPMPVAFAGPASLAGMAKNGRATEKKKIEAPYGSIVSVQSKTQIRGADIRKKKKVWCMICQPMNKISDGKDKQTKIITVTQHLRPVPGTDRWDIVCYCSRCEKEYMPGDMKKINHFLNQTTIVLSLGPDQPLLNIMMFKDNFKVAGCKKIDDAMEAIMFLWQEHICHYASDWKFKRIKKVGPYSSTRRTHPQFAIEPVMTNVDFKLGLAIDRAALNRLLNMKKYSHMINGADYEPTSQTNVSCRVYSRKPEDFSYAWLHIPLPRVDVPSRVLRPYVLPLAAVTWRKMKPPKKYNTFIVFSSSEIILSGRFHSSMKAAYEFFVHATMSNKSQIQENLKAPDQKKISRLRKKIEPVVPPEGLSKSKAPKKKSAGRKEKR